jgi:hypothetical protein
VSAATEIGFMNNVQLYFAIGIPAFTVLVGIVIGLFRSNHVLNQLNLRFTSLESRFTSPEGRIQLLDGDGKTLVRASNGLDVRLARLEERLAR